MRWKWVQVHSGCDGDTETQCLGAQGVMETQIWSEISITVQFSLGRNSIHSCSVCACVTCPAASLSGCSHVKS